MPYYARSERISSSSGSASRGMSESRSATKWALSPLILFQPRVAKETFDFFATPGAAAPGLIFDQQRRHLHFGQQFTTAGMLQIPAADAADPGTQLMHDRWRRLLPSGQCFPERCFQLIQASLQQSGPDGRPPDLPPESFGRGRSQHQAGSGHPPGEFFQQIKKHTAPQGNTEHNGTADPEKIEQGYGIQRTAIGSGLRFQPMDSQIAQDHPVAGFGKIREIAPGQILIGGIIVQEQHGWAAPEILIINFRLIDFCFHYPLSFTQMITFPPVRRLRHLPLSAGNALVFWGTTSASHIPMFYTPWGNRQNPFSSAACNLR